MCWGAGANLGLWRCNSMKHKDARRAWKCNSMKDGDHSTRQQEQMISGKSFPQVSNKLFANFFILKSLQGKTFQWALLNWSAHGQASFCQAPQGPALSQLFVPPLPTVVCSSEECQKQQWEVRGCLPAGRVLEIDPPTSKVIWCHCSTTEKTGSKRN